MAKVIVAQPIAEEGIRMLLDQDFEVEQLEDHRVETLAAEIADADAMLVRDALVPREVIEAGRRLRVISRHGAGLERIDVQAATECGVYVTRTPVANSVSVAEHVVGMMLSLAKHFLRVDRALRNGDFEIRHRLYGMELEGKTLSIVGLGNVGSRLARKALHGLGMRVVGYDPYGDTAVLDPEVDLTNSRERVFREGDFVSLHLPLNDETRGSVGSAEFEMMKTTAFLINCARGPIVKEADLVDALRRGRIAGAGIDVYDPDPPAQGHPLFAMENVIVTPHSAAHTHEAMVKMATQAAQGIIEVLSGRNPTWPANRVEATSP